MKLSYFSKLLVRNGAKLSILLTFLLFCFVVRSVASTMIINYSLQRTVQKNRKTTAHFWASIHFGFQTHDVLALSLVYDDQILIGHTYASCLTFVLLHLCSVCNDETYSTTHARATSGTTKNCWNPSIVRNDVKLSDVRLRPRWHWTMYDSSNCLKRR